ncbi:MAG: substrate-binding domain-containing protein, partial [Armatimonadetes bacterium]|nr:substrate-binding domain-containing protein [Armatimonadota bacterium]
MAGRTGTILCMRAGTILGLAGLLALAGCGNGDSEGEGSYRIAVIPKGTAHEFWKTVAAGARQAGEDLGVKVIWKGPLKEDERSEQIKVVNDFIVQEVDGICLAPLDSKGLRKPVADAVKADIPVVIFDSGIEDSEIVSFVATDNYQAGVLAARRMGALLDGSGEVALMRMVPGSHSTNQREEGFKYTVAKEFPGIEIVAEDYCMADYAKSLEIAENFLTAHPELDGIFGSTEPAIVGPAQA